MTKVHVVHIAFGAHLVKTSKSLSSSEFMHSTMHSNDKAYALLAFSSEFVSDDLTPSKASMPMVISSPTSASVITSSLSDTRSSTPFSALSDCCCCCCFSLGFSWSSSSLAVACGYGSVQIVNVDVTNKFYREEHQTDRCQAICLNKLSIT